MKSLGLFILGFTLMLTTMAAEARECSTVTESQEHFQHRKFKSFFEVTSQFALMNKPELQHKVHEIFKNGNLSIQEKYAESFKLYVEARIAMLPTVIQNKAREMTEKVIYRDPEKREIQGFYALSSHELTVRIPPELRGLLLDYVVRVHELEHLLQNFQVSPEVYAFPSRGKKEYVEFFFEGEKGAMAAEALFLFVIPREIVLADLNAAKKFTTSRQILKAMEKAQDLNEYLRAQWDLGRYSEDNIQAAYYGEKMQKWVQLAKVSGVLYFIYKVFDLYHQTGMTP